MPSWLKSVEATGLFGRLDLQQDFQNGINVIYGVNGSGKTTLLHMLANVLNGDFKRFAFLPFSSIKVQFDDDTLVVLDRDRSDDKEYITVKNDGVISEEISVDAVLMEERQHAMGSSARRALAEEFKQARPLLPAAYFPAFRSMIEAWASMRDEHGALIRKRAGFREGMEMAPGQRIHETNFARELFGEFVPRVNYPSPLEISERIGAEIQEALFKVTQTDRKVLSEAFVKTFAALADAPATLEAKPEDILEQIKTLSDRLEQSSFSLAAPFFPFFSGAYFELRQMLPSIELSGASEGIVISILDLYEKSLREIVDVQEVSFEQIKRYLASVNEFLKGKTLIVRKASAKLARLSVAVQFDDGVMRSLRVLSSGERQILTLIYAATHMSAESVVLIDEPEISLHVDWQRLLLKKMSEQLGERQIIACTHSPVVGADFLDRMRELQSGHSRTGGRAACMADEQGEGC
jgi:predicted ATPase